MLKSSLDPVSLRVIGASLPPKLDSTKRYSAVCKRCCIVETYYKCGFCHDCHVVRPEHTRPPLQLHLQPDECYYYTPTRIYDQLLSSMSDDEKDQARIKAAEAFKNEKNANERRADVLEYESLPCEDIVFEDGQKKPIQ